ncbi:protein C [Stenotrophomonas maltophilia]|uniref:S49 family peptidase n=1 Tax=Stenotrophomonas chelatiphaga TaxID=517011 RepID=UPI000F4D2699|nr:S49 family peptidase [Stenotrophomonas chelatiphaga]MCS4231366.1 ClpP class serine protease [Stenotrophomonas chelatiphaga]ROQ42447.1 protein C [Stenotrophomonas maltophilia]
MNSKPGLLARIFGRGSRAPVVSSLAAVALNSPLLVHQGHGEAIIGAYLTGEVTSADTEMRTERLELPDAGDTVAPDRSLIGVINVSGALVNRPMPGPSGAGPMNYAALRGTFDELIEDDRVGTIILRLDSPGGMAAGCFDLVDHIYAARGSKPIYALVDDNAYSACYALATACDEIWLSRTGGVGSVGVVAYHYDWSAADERMGLRATPIYAGSRKVDLSPHMPLSDEARASAQANIDALYGMFVDTVARNLGIDADAVRATEAACFQGQAAVDAGFATRLGTWHDLLAHVGASDTEEPTAPGDAGPDDAQQAASTLPQPEASPAPHAAVEKDPAAVLAVAVASSDLPPALAVAVLRRTPQAGEPATSAIEYATAVQDACAAALRGDDTLAASFIEKNTDLDTVRAQLLSMKAEEGRNTQVITAQPASKADQRVADVKAQLNPNHIYKQRGN